MYEYVKLMNCNVDLQLGHVLRCLRYLCCLSKRRNLQSRQCRHSVSNTVHPNVFAWHQDETTRERTTRERVMKGPGVLKSEKSDITVSSPIHWHPIIQLRAQELLMEVASDLTGQGVQNLSIVQPSCHLSLFLVSESTGSIIDVSLLHFWSSSGLHPQ